MNQQPDKLKNIGSPISQGNVGAKFEDSVAAWCMARMVCKEELSQIPGMPIEVGVQAKHKAPKIDDVLVIVEHGRERKNVFIQSKLTLAFTPGDVEYSETILAVRDRLLASASDQEIYVIAFQHNENNKHERLDRLLLYAQTSPDAEEWLARAEKDAYVKEAITTLRGILAVDGSPPVSDLLYRLCRQLHLWKKELMTASARDKEEALGCLRDYVRGGPDDRRLFWNTLISLVGKLSGVRGSVTRQELINDPALRSLYREPGISDVTANQISERWLSDKREKAKRLNDDVVVGKAYETLLETESQLAEINRLRLLTDSQTPAGKDLEHLVCDLLTAKGRGLHILDFQAEIPMWISEAKALATTEDLWIQVGRCASVIEDRASLGEACQRVRNVDYRSMLRVRLALLDGDEGVAWQIADTVEGEAAKEVLGLRASHLLNNLDEDATRLQEALNWAERQSDSYPDRILPSLNFVSAVFLAITPGPSPLYQRGAYLPSGNLGNLVIKAKSILIATLDSDAGQFEKNVAFGLLLPIQGAFRDPYIPHVPVLDDFPGYLKRSTPLRSIGYAQAMLQVGRNDLALRALQMKLASEADPETKEMLQELTNYAKTGDSGADGSIDEHPWFYRGRLYQQLSKTSDPFDAGLAEALSSSAHDLSCGPEAELLKKLATGDPEFQPIVTDLVQSFPFGLETFNGLVGYLDRTATESRTNSDQTIDNFIESLNGDDRWIAIRHCLFKLCNQLTLLLPSLHILSTWLNWAINFDEKEQVSVIAERSRYWGLDALASMADAWLASSRGDFKTACNLLDIYGEKYRITGSIGNFRDRCTLQAGLTRKLVDRKQAMLDDKDRLPGTAKFTVHALMLEGMDQVAAEVAKANLDDFKDERIALRDFIFTALQTHRLDLMPDALQRFYNLYPDDSSLQNRQLTGDEDLLGEIAAEQDRRQSAYEQVKIPLHFLGRPFAEKWFHQINRIEGLQARRYGLSGLELNTFGEEHSLWLDITALHAASRYRLWGRSGSHKLKTSRTNVEALRGDLRAMTLQFDQAEFDRNEKYRRHLEKDSVKLYQFLPKEVHDLISKPTYNNGEADVALQSWLGFPFISSFRERTTSTYHLQDLIHTMGIRGTIRVLEAERWLEMIREVHPGAYIDNPIEIKESIDRIMIDDADLRDVSRCSFAEVFFADFEQIVLGPAAVLGYSLLTMPRLWAKQALDLAKDCLAAVETAIGKGQLQVIECSSLPDTDDAAYIKQIIEIVDPADVFWCDDVMMRSVVAHESRVTTTSTYQIVRALRSAGTITDLVYRDVLSQIGTDGHRDIDGDDLLTACGQDTGFRSTPQLLRCAHRLGHTLKASSNRGDSEEELVRSHVAQHVMGFVLGLPETGIQVLTDVCRALGEGAGTLGGRTFWPRMLNTISQDLESGKQGFLNAVEVTVSELGQVDLSERVHSEFAMYRQANAPRRINFPSPEEYFASMRIRNM